MASHKNLLSSQYLNNRNHAKVLFKQGKVSKSLTYLEQDVLNFAKERHQNGEQGALFEVLESLVLQARLKIEIGEYLAADKSLQEVKAIIESHGDELQKESNVTQLYYKSKYYHLFAKNLANQLYQQKSMETFEEGVQFLEQQYKFYNEAQRLLDEIQSEVNDEKELDEENSIKQKKLLYKVHREKAKIYAYRKQLQNAEHSYSQAKQLLVELIPVTQKVGRQSLVRNDMNKSFQSQPNLKLAHLKFQKAIWLKRFNKQEAFEYFSEAFHSFGDVLDCEENSYFQANCLFEQALLNIEQQKKEEATGYLSVAIQDLDRLFGETHPISQKYYRLCAELDPTDEKQMLKMAKTYLEIIERSNSICNETSKTDPKDSIFLLEGLYFYISIISSTKKEAEVDIYIERIRDICKTHKLNEEGDCIFLYLALIVKAINLLYTRKRLTAKQLLEKCQTGLLKLLQNCDYHIMLEKCLVELTPILVELQEYDRAEVNYRSMINLYKKYYTDLSEQLVIIQKQLATLLNEQQKPQEAYDFYLQGVRTAQNIIEAKGLSESLKTKISSLIMTMQAFLVRQTEQNNEDMTKEIESLLLKVQGGEQNIEYATFVYLEANKSMKINPDDFDQALKILQKAIVIMENIDQSKSKKSELTGKCYLQKGIFLENQAKQLQQKLTSNETDPSKQEIIIQLELEALDYYDQAKQIFLQYVHCGGMVSKCDEKIQSIGTQRFNKQSIIQEQQEEEKNDGVSQVQQRQVNETEQRIGDTRENYERKEENNSNEIFIYGTVFAVVVGALGFLVSKSLKSS